MRQNKTERKSKNKATGIIAGLVAGTAVTVILLLVTSFMIHSGKLGNDNIKIITIAINIISGFTCGITVKAVGQGGGLNGMLCGLLYSAICILPAVFSEKLSLSIASDLRILLISVVTSLLGSKIILFKSNKKLRKRRNKR